MKDVSVEMGKATYMRLLFEQDKLIKLLGANDIPCVILKGSAAAQYYPKPHLRAMGDVDFLVPRNNFEEAVALLESNGYEYHHAAIEFDFQEFCSSCGQALGWDNYENVTIRRAGERSPAEEGKTIDETESDKELMTVVLTHPF